MREHILEFHHILRAHTEKWTLKIWKPMFYMVLNTFYWGFRVLRLPHVQNQLSFRPTPQHVKSTTPATRMKYKIKKCPMSSKCPGSLTPATKNDIAQLDDGWPESEKDVFQAALRMVVVKDSRWIVGEFYMSYGKIWCEKVRLIKKGIFGKGHQMTCVLQPQRERGGRDKERERERERERKRKQERERMKGGVERKHEEM